MAAIDNLCSAAYGMAVDQSFRGINWYCWDNLQINQSFRSLSDPAKRSLEMFENVQEMSKKSIEVTMKNFEAMTKSAQTIASEMAEYTKKSLEHGTKAMQELSSVKSPDKALEVQTAYAKTAMEGFSAHISKVGELYADLTKLAFKPSEELAAKKPATK